MKKLLIVVFLISNFLAFGQQVVLDKNLSKDDYFSYENKSDKNNLLFIKNAVTTKSVINNKEKKIINCKYISIDSIGVQKIIIDTDDSFYWLTLSSKPDIYKFYNNVFYYNDKKSDKIKNLDYEKQYEHDYTFNDKYHVLVGNKRGSWLDLDKDDIYFIITDFTNGGVQTKVLAQKFDINKVTGPDFIKADRAIGARGYVEDDNIVLITKSIYKNYNKSILYKTLYDFRGKVIRETKFNIELSNNRFLINSFNGGGLNEVTSKSRDVFSDDLSINNFYVDYPTGDVFVYGLYGNKFSNLNKEVTPAGFYVFKFDKNGNKLWESVNRIDDKTHFNNNYSATSINVKFSRVGKCFNFYAFTNDNNEFLHLVYLDEDGKAIQKAKLMFNESSTSSFNQNTYLTSKIDGFTNLKDKKYDINTVIAVVKYNSIKKYLNDIIVPKGCKLDIKTLFVRDRIYLFTTLESKNESNFKIIVF